MSLFHVIQRSVYGLILHLWFQLRCLVQVCSAWYLSIHQTFITQSECQKTWRVKNIVYRVQTLKDLQVPGVGRCEDILGLNCEGQSHERPWRSFGPRLGFEKGLKLYTEGNINGNKDILWTDLKEVQLLPVVNINSYVFLKTLIYLVNSNFWNCLALHFSV